MPLRAVLLAVAALACPAAAAAQAGAVPDAAERAQASLDEYRMLLVGLARQVLAGERLAHPLPCLPHWMAGADHVVVAVSAPGAVAGLGPGDTLERIDDTALTGRPGALWDAVLRRMAPGSSSYTVEVSRGGAARQLTLPCSPARAVRLHDAERAMWTAVTRRDWTACRAHGQEMIDAFGAPFSPPLLVMTRCVAAAPEADPALTYALATTLLDELVAHPAPSPDQREQLDMTLRTLDATGAGSDATALRARMAALGVTAGPPAAPSSGR